jgi:hypothetical protein
MTRQHNTSESVKSIAGGILVGLGLHLLAANLAGDAIQLRHLLGIPREDAWGMLPAVALAASHAAQAYAVDQQEFLDNLLQILASFWPLVPVIIGGLLLRDALADQTKTVPTTDKCVQNKYLQNKDMECRFRCPSFDA